MIGLNNMKFVCMEDAQRYLKNPGGYVREKNGDSKPSVKSASGRNFEWSDGVYNTSLAGNKFSIIGPMGSYQLRNTSILILGQSFKFSISDCWINGNLVLANGRPLT